MKYNIEILNESGYEQAMLGLSLSYNRPVHEMGNVARKIYKNGSHGKFLESICLWLDITASRDWWVQADTYRIGVTKQSGSTMHTLLKRQLTQDDFEGPIFQSTLEALNFKIKAYNWVKNGNKGDKYEGDLGTLFTQIKKNLPEGFLQRRIVCTNYKTIRHIIGQRKNHKLNEWVVFCAYLKENAKYKEFLE